MTKIIKLQNGKKEWFLYGGYNTKEIFEFEGIVEGEIVNFQFYANGESSPMHCFDMNMVNREETTLIFESRNKPEARIRVEQTGDLTWIIKLFIDNIERIPEMNYISRKLCDLIDQVEDYKTVYALCLEGEMAGKILRIQHNGIGWLLNWEHNNQIAEKSLEKTFAIIKDSNIMISECSKINLIDDIRSFNYQFGVLVARTVDLKNKEHEIINQFTIILSSIGYENLIYDVMYEGFKHEVNTSEPSYSNEEIRNIFNRCIEMMNINFVGN